MERARSLTPYLGCYFPHYPSYRRGHCFSGRLDRRRKQRREHHAWRDCFPVGFVPVDRVSSSSRANFFHPAVITCYILFATEYMIRYSTDRPVTDRFQIKPKRDPVDAERKPDIDNTANSEPNSLSSQFRPGVLTRKLTILLFALVLEAVFLYIRHRPYTSSYPILLIINTGPYTVRSNLSMAGRARSFPQRSTSVRLASTYTVQVRLTHLRYFRWRDDCSGHVHVEFSASVMAARRSQTTCK